MWAKSLTDIINDRDANVDVDYQIRQKQLSQNCLTTIKHLLSHLNDPDSPIYKDIATKIAEGKDQIVSPGLSFNPFSKSDAEIRRLYANLWSCERHQQAVKLYEESTGRLQLICDYTNDHISFRVLNRHELKHSPKFHSYIYAYVPY